MCSYIPCVVCECVLVQECVSQRKYIWLSRVCDGTGLCFGAGVCVVFSVKSNEGARLAEMCVGYKVCVTAGVCVWSAGMCVWAPLCVGVCFF